MATFMDLFGLRASGRDKKAKTDEGSEQEMLKEKRQVRDVRRAVFAVIVVLPAFVHAPR